MTYVLGILVAVQVVAGQVLWRAAVRNANLESVHDAFGRPGLALLFSPRMIAGTLLYAIAAGLYLYMQAKYEYHVVQTIVICASLVLSFASASWLLHEKITAVDIGALLLIVAGTALIGRH